jgi:Zn-dependent protease
MKEPDVAIRPPLSGGAPVPAPAVAPAFRWSRRLVTILGIDVYLHVTFLLLVGFLAFSDLVAGGGGGGIAAMLRGTALLLAVFAMVLLHEFGHALMARRFGVRTIDITLLPIGGVARLGRLPDRPGQQLLVALAGPAVNVGAALLLLVALRLLGGPLTWGGVAPGDGSFLAQLLWINVSLAAFNLLPGYPMDGGRVLRALLAMRMAPERATRIAARVGQGVAVVFGLVGLAVSPLLLVIGVFVWMGAQAEYALAASTEAAAARAQAGADAGTGPEAGR